EGAGPGGGGEGAEGGGGGGGSVGRGGAPPPLLLEVLQKGHDVVHGEVGDVQFDHWALRRTGEEAKEQGHAVAIAPGRVGTDAADRGQVVGEECAQGRRQGIRGRRHRRLPRGGVAGPSIRLRQCCANRFVASVRSGSTKGTD